MDPIPRSLDMLANWLRTNGIAGWDPYDVLSHPILLALGREARKGGWTARWTYLPIAKVRVYPRAARRLFMIRPRVNAKGVGLLLHGWLKAKQLGFVDADEQSGALVAWLKANTAREYPGASWGYPFHWQSRIRIPRGTPSSVVTCTCAHALLDYAGAAGDEEALALAEGAGIFISEALNRHESNDGGICFSYTPLDTWQVLNASLMASEYLLRAGSVFGRPDWVDLALRGLKFALSEQQPDGSFEYWSQAQMAKSQIDHYHTGFVLRSVHAFAEVGADGAAKALDLGWEHYCANFHSDDGRPLNYPSRALPLDIHSCAEAILCPTVLSTRYGDDAIALARRAATWTCQNMQNSDGSFAYKLYDDHLDTMAYLRWGQAWMFRVLTELATTLDE